jgi:hypothetical protein
MWAILVDQSAIHVNGHEYPASASTAPGTGLRRMPDRTRG